MDITVDITPIDPHQVSAIYIIIIPGDPVHINPELLITAYDTST